MAADHEAIASIVRTFFAAFTSGPESAARLDALRAVFLSEAVIVRTGGGEPAVYGVDSFIAPRQALLSSGTLVDFSEWELRGHTEIFGDIAHHFGSYAKAGVQDGVPFTARGMKTSGVFGLSRATVRRTVVSCPVKPCSATRRS